MHFILVSDLLIKGRSKIIKKETLKEKKKQKTTKEKILAIRKKQNVFGNV